MTTLRDVGIDALRSLKALAPGDGMTADEINVVLDAVQSVLLELHEARGPMRDVDISADYTAGENERVRIDDGITATVSLPNSVRVMNGQPCADYGFIAVTGFPTGSLNSADGVAYRAPRDGTRVEIVGMTQALYFYRADVNTWVQADQRLIDSLCPLNSRYRGDVAALVASRLIDSWPDIDEPTPNLARRIARANSHLLIRSGTARDPVRGEYF